MTKSLKSKIFIVSVILILFLGFFLRKNDINTWPREGATFDEYAWTWQGMNLIKTGVPTSWSPHPQYEKFKLIKYHNAYFRLVTPYLEHPPLFGIVAGSYALLNGVDKIEKTEISKIRGLALILGTLSIVLIILLTNELYGKKIALLSGLLYATIPTVAVGSKIVQNENFFIPMWLFALWLVVRYLSNKKSLFLYAAGLVCGLLILAKIPWVAASFSVLIILFYNKKYKDVLKFMIFPILAIVVFFAYGFYYDKNLFLGLWGLQLNRYDLGFTSIFALFQKPFLIDRFFTDGWIYWGWFAFILLLVKDVRKNIVVFSAFISYFLIFLAGIPDESGHGWYRYPFYPFLIIGLAFFIKDYFNKNYFLTFLFLVFVGTSLLDYVWVPKFGFSYFVFRFAIVGWGLSLVPQYLKNEKIAKMSGILNYAWLFLFIVMNIFAVLHYNEQ